MTPFFSNPTTRPSLISTLWQAAKSFLFSFWRPIAGLIVPPLFYFGAPSAGFEYRGAAALIGVALCALIIRSELFALRTLFWGVAAYCIVLATGYWEEIISNRGFLAETLVETILLNQHERASAWHGGALLAALVVFLIGRARDEGKPWLEKYTWLNGSFYADVAALSKWLLKSIAEQKEGSLRFGMLRIPASWAQRNFFFAGVIGCGKTTFLKHLMEDALRAIRQGSDQRALIYDQKGEFYPFILALGLSVRTHLINPLDRRSLWWDIAAEAVDGKTARQLAAAFVPDADPTQATRESGFFTEKARGVVAGIIISFQRHSPNLWTFADLAIALSRREYYEAILRRDTDLSSLVDSLEHDEVRGDVFATLDRYRWKYDLVAALWDNARLNGNPSFTVKEWLRGDEIFVLTQDKAAGETLNPIFQAILRLIAEGMSSQGDSKTRRTWLFLDEFTTLGRIPLISEILNTCRSRGACTTVAVQSVERLREVYTDHETNNIVDALKCKAIFRSGPETAKWAQDVFGKAEYFVERKGDSFTVSQTGTQSSTSSSSSTHRNREQVPLFRSDYFLNLPEPNERNGFHAGIWLDGYAYAGHAGFHEAIHAVPQPLDVLGYEPAPPEWQVLKPWDEADLKRLRLLHLLSGETASGQSVPPPDGKENHAPTPKKAKSSKITIKR